MPSPEVKRKIEAENRSLNDAFAMLREAHKIGRNTVAAHLDVQGINDALAVRNERILGAAHLLLRNFPIEPVVDFRVRPSIVGEAT